jgi:hypothetical protein
MKNLDSNKTSITDFTDTILHPLLRYKIGDYTQSLIDAGYYSVFVYNPASKWEEIHFWLKTNVNYSDYTWFGSIFWFTYECDAVWFALKFSGV